MLPTPIPNLFFGLATAFLKYQIKLGRDDLFLEINGSDVQKLFDDFFTSGKINEELLLAADVADDYFQKHCKDNSLKQAFSLTFGNLLSVQNALKELPNEIDANGVEQTIREALLRDCPTLTTAQIGVGAKLYSDSLQNALLKFKTYFFPILGQIVVEIRQKQKDHDEKFSRMIQALDRLEENILSKADEELIQKSYAQNDIRIQGGSLVIIGSKNVIKLEQNQFRQLMNIVAIPGTLPFGSYLPFLKNPRFTGRIKDLNRLLTILTIDKSSSKSKSKLCAFVITGMAGVGKTQLVVEFAYKYGYHFQGVHWINMHHPDGLEAAIALCGKEMGLPYTDLLSMYHYTMQAWVTDGPRLLILDNFDEIDSADEVLAPFLNPALRLVITSRHRDWSRNLASVHEFELSPFTKSQSIVFLKQILETKNSTEVLDSLATQLGNLPLALTMAANYINITKVQIDKYQKELQEFKYSFIHESMKSDWFAEMDITSPTHYREGLMATFQISWTRLKNDDHQNIYKISGYCAPNTPIPLEIFREAIGKNEKTLKSALYRLNSLSLINLSAELPTIHPLLAEHARYLILPVLLLGDRWHTCLLSR